MSLLPQTATARISLAIGLSLLLHSVALFSPLIELPKTEAPLPPLTAKLEPLPKIAPAPPKKPKPKRTETKPPDMPTQGTPAKEMPAPAVEEEAPQIDDEPQPAADDAPVEEPAPEKEAQARPALPRHARLTFSAYQGEGGLKLGEATHRLEIEQGQYVLETVTLTTGIASLFKTYLLTQSSRGLANAQGLRPLSYSEEKALSSGKQSLSAAFDWDGRKLHFSHGGEAALPEQGQDIVSFLYQLSQLPMSGRDILPMHISNGKKLEYYELKIGEEEEIQTPLGKLRALPLRKLHGPGEEGLDVWLGLEYRLLPIKIRQIDRSGKTAGEMVISEILVSDE
ncbi:MAG: hypothetical protein A2063_08375 [Gallionellales bacterium GWA2_60_142]|nr:MAG: hypothetical protein A2063_08375 [Gallionellales bacterium GWA2_60_142]HCI12704.1 hypothetical protein [Gallionellaceae bacterium]